MGAAVSVHLYISIILTIDWSFLFFVIVFHVTCVGLHCSWSFAIHVWGGCILVVDMFTSSSSVWGITRTISWVYAEIEFALLYFGTNSFEGFTQAPCTFRIVEYAFINVLLNLVYDSLRWRFYGFWVYIQNLGCIHLARDMVYCQSCSSNTQTCRE